MSIPTANPVTSLGAAVTVLFHVGGQRRGASEFVRRRMRAFSNIISVLFLACCTAAAHSDRDVPAQTVSLTFGTEGKASFEFTNGRVRAIRLHIGQATYAVPTNICSRLREIRFDTARLCWNGSYKSAAEADYFYLQFNMGPPRLGPPPDIPPVELKFRNGKFQKATGIDVP